MFKRFIERKNKYNFNEVVRILLGRGFKKGETKEEIIKVRRQYSSGANKYDYYKITISVQYISNCENWEEGIELIEDC